MRLIDADALINDAFDLISREELREDVPQIIKDYCDAQPTIDAVPVIRCKDCKHRPMRGGDRKRGGFNIDFPSERCPCQCDDPWYNWMPDDDWFCGNAERKEE